MERFDCIVIGGGILGLSVAWAIMQKNPSVHIAVLEKEGDWASDQTGRNSGVMHSGIYYKPGSLKAKMCREGNRRMVEFCEQHGIHYEVCGKLVATRPDELPLMENLYERGIANGLTVRKLTAHEVNELEPHVSCLAGISVSSTGIVDFAGVCRKLAALIGTRGGALHCASGFAPANFATLSLCKRAQLMIRRVVKVSCDVSRTVWPGVQRNPSTLVPKSLSVANTMS